MKYPTYYGKQRPFKQRDIQAIERPILAYDLEATNITAGETPRPEYLTVELEPGGEVVGIPTPGNASLYEALCRYVLTPENVGKRFVAHNGNRFDEYLVAFAIAENPRYIVTPYYNRMMQIRGMMVTDRYDKRQNWHFSDSIAITGWSVGLAQLTTTFAPEYAKGHIDFDTTTFDARNPEHVEYAINDTRILSRAINNYRGMIESFTGIPIQNTIGKLAIKYFEKNMPPDVCIWNVPEPRQYLLDNTRRGGYIYAPHRYRGPLYSADINQSYTFQQRKPMPCGRCYATHNYKRDRLGIYACTIYYPNRRSVHAPCYCVGTDGKPRMVTGSEPFTTFLTSPEIEKYREWGWQIDILVGIYWAESFTMTTMSELLERERIRYGPKSPMGIIIKNVGNNSYGKTAEQHDGIRYFVAKERPDGAYMAYPEEPSSRLWVTHEQPTRDIYQKPQIAVFITAHARLQVAEVIERLGEHALYADTDSIKSDRDVREYLDIDDARYGAWKYEGYDNDAIILNKKSYWFRDEPCWKGLSVSRLTRDEYVYCYETGVPPEQVQRQRLSMQRVLRGEPMFREMRRHGSTPLPLSLDIAD